MSVFIDVKIANQIRKGGAMQKCSTGFSATTVGFPINENISSEHLSSRARRAVLRLSLWPVLVLLFLLPGIVLAAAPVISGVDSLPIYFEDYPETTVDATITITDSDSTLFDNLQQKFAPRP